MLVRNWGLCDYEPVYHTMQQWTQARTPETPDELWVCQHHPIYTTGKAGLTEHLAVASTIPSLVTDRGGQVTYHGPGQVVIYPLLNLRRLQLYAKTYVFRLEEAILRTLLDFGLTGHRVVGAPGVYVRWPYQQDDHAIQPKPPTPPLYPTSPTPTPTPTPHSPFAHLAKIAALGIKISRHYSYHGLALNVAMDVSPYAAIHPCGYAGLTTVTMQQCGSHAAWDDVAASLIQHLYALFQP